MAQLLEFRNDYFLGIKQGNLPNAAHGEFHHDILTKAKATEAIVQVLAGPLGVYETAVQKETEASYKDMTDSITKRINEVLVPKRNSVETGFKAELRAKEESDDQAVAAAARMLTELAHLHHMHTDLKLNSQTDAIRDYVSDVEANHQEALELVGATVLFNKLKAANDAVCEAVMERTEIEARRATGEMLAARGKTDKAYRGLTYCVTAQIYMQGLEPYRDFVIFTNQLIKDYRRTYIGGAGNSTEEEEVEEEETEEETEGGATGGEQTDGEQGSEETGSETTEPTFTVTYIKGQYTWMTQQYAAGDRIVPPAEPEAFRWVDVPEFMPDHDITIYAQYVG